MSYAVIGFLIWILSLESAIVAMFGHGFISAGLFFSIGYIYNRYGQRDLRYLMNMKLKLPEVFCAMLILAFMNTSFPGTVNFPAELGIFLAVFSKNALLPLLLCFPLIMNGVFNITTITRICFGPDKLTQSSERVEELVESHFILYSLVGFIILFGINPSIITHNLEAFVLSL